MSPVCFVKHLPGMLKDWTPCAWGLVVVVSAYVDRPASDRYHYGLLSAKVCFEAQGRARISGHCGGTNLSRSATNGFIIEWHGIGKSWIAPSRRCARRTLEAEKSSTLRVRAVDR